MKSTRTVTPPAGERACIWLDVPEGAQERFRFTVEHLQIEQGGFASTPGGKNPSLGGR